MALASPELEATCTISDLGIDIPLKVKVLSSSVSLNCAIADYDECAPCWPSVYMAESLVLWDNRGSRVASSCSIHGTGSN